MKKTRKTTKRVSSTTRRPASAVAKALPQPAPVAATPEERKQMIEEAAYYKALRDQYRRDPIVYWLEAEDEIDRQMGWR